jgi:hypothetical protein
MVNNSTNIVVLFYVYGRDDNATSVAFNWESWFQQPSGPNGASALFRD